MEVVLLESEAYKRLQRDNVTLIRSLLQEERKDPAFGWVGHKEAAQILNVSTRTMQSWRDEGLLGFSQVKKTLFYHYDDMDKMLRQHYHKSFKAGA